MESQADPPKVSGPIRIITIHRTKDILRQSSGCCQSGGISSQRTLFGNRRR